MTKDKQFLLDVNLVRGAYMEKERERAQKNGYTSPIYAHKEVVDCCLQHLDSIALVLASHNELNNHLAVQTMQNKQLVNNHHPHRHFSQLYGMSDHVTFNMAAASYSVSPYFPFGPIKNVIPYPMRRAEEKASVNGQTGRELGLIRKELTRRQGK